MSKTAEQCKAEYQQKMEALVRTGATKMDPEFIRALDRIAAALERLGDAYLYVNQQEDEPSFEGQSLSDREHL
jgi:hypothetical protein